MPWWKTSQLNSKIYLPVLTWWLRGHHRQHSGKLLTYTEGDQPSNAQHGHCMDTAPVQLVPPDPTMPRWEHDSSDKYSEEPNTSYHLPGLLDHFQQLWDQVAPLGTCQPVTHTYGGLPQLAEGLQQLIVVLQPSPNPQPKEPMYTTMYANITMILLQDIPMLDGQDSSKLEDSFMDIETTTDILTRSCTCLAKTKACSLTCTLIHRVLQTGKPQDTGISNNNNLPDKVTSTVPLKCPSTYYSHPLPAILL